MNSKMLIIKDQKNNINFMKVLIIGCFATIISLTTFSCKKNKDCVSIPSVQSGICIDSNLIGNANECIEIIDPVCGCDGITYDNYCVADSSGITSYVAGECCK